MGHLRDSPVPTAPAARLWSRLGTTIPIWATVSEQSSGYPLAHPSSLYKYSNDGEYLSKSIAERNKVNIDPFPTPTEESGF
jgi:hypothetical protein